MALQILKGFELGERDCADTMHKQIEAMKLAMMDTAAHVADPRTMRVTVDELLSERYAADRRAAGMSLSQAAVSAAKARLRPILMTSASTVLGLIPLAFATGEGCNQRIAMGTAVVGGMVVSTLLTMYIVPAIYSYISTNRIKKLQE